MHSRRVARCCVAAVALVTLAGAMLAGAEEPNARGWSQWRGPNRDGVSPDTRLLKSWPETGPELVWKATDLGGGYSTPSLHDGRLFAMSYRGADEVVWAVDANSGKELWVTRIGSSARVDHGEGSRSTPTVDGDVLYAIGVSGDLVCLETATGKERWHRHLEKDFGGRRPGWGYSESVLIDGDRAVCTPGGSNGAVVALDKRTGDLIWQSKDFKDRAAYASLVISNVGGIRHYVQMTHDSVVGIAADNGRVLWHYAREGPTAAVPTPILNGNYVYATSGYGAGCHLVHLVTSGGEIKAEEVYANKTMSNHHGGVVLVGEHLYGFSDGKGWICQDFKTGEMVWNEKRKLGKGSVTFADGHLYARSEAGVVALLEATPGGYVEKGRFQQPERSQHNAWPHPVVIGGRLYLRDQDILLCYDVKDPAARADAAR